MDINTYKLSVKDTNYLKGFALLMMIIHHLFWNISGYGFEIKGVYLWEFVGIGFKICVPIYLILSGYALYICNSDNLNIKQFHIKRISKVYYNYIFIVIIALLIGRFLFYDKYIQMLGVSIWVRTIKIVITLTGFQYLFGYNFINSSWWFITQILICYILFPILLSALKKYDKLFYILIFIFCNIAILVPKLYEINTLIYYISAFVLGMFLAKKSLIERIMVIINCNKKKYRFFIMLYVSIITLFYCQYRIGIDGIGLMVTPFSSIVMIILLLRIKNKLSYIYKYFNYVSKYNFDMYLLHMFITTYYVKTFVYGFRYPIIIISVSYLLTLSIAIIVNEFRKRFFLFLNYAGIVKEKQKGLLYE